MDGSSDEEIEDDQPDSETCDEPKDYWEQQDVERRVARFDPERGGVMKNAQHQVRGGGSSGYGVGRSSDALGAAGQCARPQRGATVQRDEAGCR